MWISPDCSASTTSKFTAGWSEISLTCIAGTVLSDRTLRSETKLKDLTSCWPMSYMVHRRGECSAI